MVENREFYELPSLLRNLFKDKTQLLPSVKELVRALDSKQGENILQKIDIKSKQGLNSIVNNKNNIAHGEVSNATIGDIMGYYQDVLKIFEALEKILLS